MQDLISRQAAIDGFYEMASDMDHLCTVSDYVSFLESIPSAQPETMNYPQVDGVTPSVIAQPSYTEAEIQKIQDLEQAEIQKAYELGREEGQKEAQPEPQWIPCSERLPEDDDIVLITMDDSITIRGEFFEQISNELGFFKEGVWHWGYEIGEAYWPETTHVTAWMPLPEPYKEKGKTNEITVRMDIYTTHEGQNNA